MNYDYSALMGLLQNPPLQYVILVLGLCLLLLELLTPGFAFFGIIGLLLLAEFFIVGFKMFSYSYILAFLGLFLIILEVVTGFTGLLFTMGVLSMITGLILAIYYSAMAFNWVLLVILLIVLILICFGFYLGVRKIISLKRRKSQFFALKNEVGRILNLEDQNQLAQCRIDGAIWSVKSKELLELGDLVRVVKMDLDNAILEVIKEKV